MLDVPVDELTSTALPPVPPSYSRHASDATAGPPFASVGTRLSIWRPRYSAADQCRRLLTSYLYIPVPTVGINPPLAPVRSTGVQWHDTSLNTLVSAWYRYYLDDHTVSGEMFFLEWLIAQLQGSPAKICKHTEWSDWYKDGLVYFASSIPKSKQFKIVYRNCVANTLRTTRQIFYRNQL